jgi:hypothetical protein
VRRRPTIFILLLVAVLALAVALDSAVLGIVAALMLLAVIIEALGHGEADMLDPMQAAERKRTALGRMRRGRVWDHHAPDHADEPPDIIFAREAERRQGK